MNPIKLKNALWVFLTIYSSQLSAQNFYVNKAWETETVLLGTQNHASSVLDQNGNVISVCNKRNSNTANIYLNKMNNSGNVTWQSEVNNTANVSGTENKGTDIKKDASGNTIICGANYNGSNYDYLIVKYNSSGVELWRKSYNGTGNGDDLPSSLTLDANGNVYVTGASKGLLSESDFLTLKLNGQNGAILWNARYDYALKYDVATQIKLDNQGKVLVCGGSAQNLLNADIVVIKYNPINGNQMQIKRHDSPQNGYDVPVGMEIDANNNIYVLGTANANLVNNDIKLISYNTSNLNINWVKYMDLNGLEDEAWGLTIDNLGKLIITGNTKNIQNQINMLTAKYNPTNGSEIWRKIEEVTDIVSESKGKKVKTDANGNIVVVGEIILNGISHLKVISFDVNGNKRWEKINENTTSSPQKAMDLIVKDDAVYMTGVKETGSEQQLVTTKLETKRPVGEFELDGNGEPTYAKHHLIVRFQKEALNLETIDNLDIQFERAEKFLRPEALQNFFDAVKPKNGVGVDFNKIVFYRIYSGLKSTDNTIVSHLGETIEVPSFYGAFMVEFPEGFEMPTTANQLQKIFPTVVYTDPIVAKFATTNDTKYPIQSNLHPTAEYPDAGINVEEAWNYTTGKPFVHVGIFDNGVMWEHEDFGNGVMNQSNVKKSYNFVNMVDESTTINAYFDSHGTASAGIIAGLNNNNRGIAGIAGGSTGSYNNSISMYSLRIRQLPYGMDMATEFNAIFESIKPTSAATINTPYRYGLQIQNHTWVYLFDFNNGVWDDHNMDLLRDNIHFINRHKTVFAAGAGNNGNDYLLTPAAIDDKWILSVGGTGTDGKHWDAINDNPMVWNQQLQDSVEANGAGNYSYDLDIAAPASHFLITSTIKDSTNGYAPFNGTSAATPHAVGTVALLMSYYNDPVNPDNYKNLAPEDCEQILEMTATVVDTTYSLPYTGHGRLNAGKALAQIDTNIFTLRHIKSNMYNTTEVITPLTTSFDTVKLLETYSNLDNQWFAPQNYFVKRFRISHEINHDIAVDSFIRAFWPRHSSSTLLEDINAYNEIKPREKVEFESIDYNNAKLFGYAYAVYDTTQQFLGWWPRNINFLNINFEYSVLLCNEYTANVVNIDNENQLQVFPNPTNGNQQIVLNLKDRQNIQIGLYDLSGKEVLNVYNGKADIGKTEINVDLSNLSTGLYVYKISLDNTVKFMKIQKL